MCREIGVRKDLRYIGISGKLRINRRDAINHYSVSMCFCFLYYGFYHMAFLWEVVTQIHALSEVWYDNRRVGKRGY